MIRWSVAQYALPSERQRVESIAAAVEKLAPAADNSGQPRNVEYPWATSEAVVAPADDGFADLGTGSRDMVRFLTVVLLVLNEFDALA